jgi:hypothetical protein
VANYRQTMKFAYFQDDWKVNRKLTLNLGLRYEYATPQWERDLKLSNFDPATNKLIAAKAGSIADRAQVNPDRNNFGPRIGLAYSLNSKTVIRAGYGISYVNFNRAGGGNLLAINGPQVVIADILQRPTDANFRTTQQGYPLGLTSTDQFDPLKSNISYIPRDTPSGMIQNWSFSIQRELPAHFLVDLGYVGNNSSHLVIFADYNEARPMSLAEAALPAAQQPTVQARRPNPNFSAITVTFPWARANYNALQARVERRFTNGFSLLNSFVWSKAIDTTGQALEAQNGSGGRSSPQSFYNLNAERAVSDFDQPFNNVTSALWEVPVGKGRRFAKSLPGLAEMVIGGWQLSGIHTVGSGTPVNLTYTPAAAQMVSINIPDWRGGISYRPNVIGPIVPASGRDYNNWLNVNNVVAPTSPAAPFGNAGRNIARRPGFIQMDLGVQKAFALPRENTSLSFRMEAFNLFNHTNFGNPGVNRSTAATFGRITSTFFPARQVQFALRLSF